MLYKAKAKRLSLLILILLILSFIGYEKHYASSETKLKPEEKSKMNKKSNRLIKEKSPYLRQHAFNPVDWYPWGEEAFNRAKSENKPIFLSIGYSSCHWCHVMEHESFEDEEVAALLNKDYIAIKVDREERPDIDQVYMTVCQMMTGSGGWPLTIIMTPDKKPFFAATYIPKGSSYGRVGMMELLPQVNKIWTDKHAEVISSADKIVSYLKRESNQTSKSEFSRDVFKKATVDLSQRFDEKLGGFNPAPKFPSPHTLIFLVRQWKRDGDPKTLLMVEKTLQAMRLGGIFDQVGYGFHRYSTDTKWLLPHFEKMLYDQAMHILAYTEAYQATNKSVYRQVVGEVTSYLFRDMKSPEGAFYSAEDADSDGEEGKFYVWTRAELEKILSESELQFLEKNFQVRSEGNFHDEASGKMTGSNILHLTKSLSSESDQLFKPIREKLMKFRAQRERPLLDNKILTDWNGLTIAALAKAARVFESPEYKTAAMKTADFILNKARDSQGRLWHRHSEGHNAVPGQIDDYAFMIWGLLELYETTLRTRYLESALQLSKIAIKHFWDGKNGGFFMTADYAEKLPTRPKDYYDGAIPSGNSVMYMNLLKLARLCGDPKLEDFAAKLALSVPSSLMQSPASFAHFLNAAGFATGPSIDVVINGDPNAEETKQLIKAINKLHLPYKTILLKPIGPEGETIAKLAPHTAAYSAPKKPYLVNICRDKACALPVDTVEETIKLLK